MENKSVSDGFIISVKTAPGDGVSESVEICSSCCKCQLLTQEVLSTKHIPQYCTVYSRESPTFHSPEPLFYKIWKNVNKPLF